MKRKDFIKQTAAFAGGSIFLPTEDGFAKRKGV